MADRGRKEFEAELYKCTNPAYAARKHYESLRSVSITSSIVQMPQIVLQHRLHFETRCISLSRNHADSGQRRKR
jgi:hypothetical protein